MLIKARRALTNITQEELAKFLDISRSTVAMWETGDSLPRADKLPQLAELLGCTIDELYEKDEVL